MNSKPLISLIWAMDENRLIGSNNALPWRLPADMAWFKKNTLAKPILMGRKTYDSIGRPLPGRTNLILSKQADLKVEGCSVIHHLDAAKTMVGDAEEIMVMGGAEIYKLLLPYADRLYITEIATACQGDSWFPAFDRSEWQPLFTESHPVDDRNIYPYSFTILERKHA
ncbi:MAG: type 3 dihydrofolate reductase [Mariprofundus sp.]|nr:type 3 dihydrofolate reductase [Mariprofundus sp.]